MFYRLTLFSLFLSLFIFNATCAKALVIKNRLNSPVFVTCRGTNNVGKLSKNTQWQEIRHNEIRDISPCEASLKVAISKKTQYIVQATATLFSCTEHYNLYKRIVSVPSHLKPGYTLNGRPKFMQVCWDDSSILPPSK